MFKLKKYTFKNKSLTLFFTLFILLFSSCEDVVNVELEMGDPKIVIDAQIIWEKGASGNDQIIKISKTASYYSTSTPKVSGAKVRIENSNGDIFIFNESEAGSYLCNNFIPVVDMTYTLYVEVEGQSFMAVEKLTAVTPIEKIEQEYIPDITGDDLVEITIYYKDPVNEINYYLTDFKSDFLLFPEYVANNDEFLNGNQINTKFSDVDLKPGKKLEIIHRGISKGFYNYMNLILEASSDNPFSTTPGNIRGNIVNVNNSNSFALGYFRICEANHISYLVK